MACPKSKTSDGLEMQFGVNHLGHFHLTNLLLPLLEKTTETTRVVNLSSMGQRLFAPADGIRFDDINGEKSYNEWERYGQSKLANVLHANEINRRYGKDGGVIAMSLHPGSILSTELSRHTSIRSGLSAVYRLFSGKGNMGIVLQERNKSIAQGASTTLVAALDRKSN